MAHADCSADYQWNLRTAYTRWRDHGCRWENVAGFATNVAWVVVLIVATFFLVRCGSFGFASARMIAYFLHSIWSFALAYIVILRNPIPFQEVIDLQVAKAATEADPAGPAAD